jgi:hypothetical protein
MQGRKEAQATADAFGHWLLLRPVRFPPPWSVEELDACFVVRDSDGQQLAYVYLGDEPGRHLRPSCSRARRGGSRRTIAKLPGLFASLKDVDIGSVGRDILFNAYLSL